MDCNYSTSYLNAPYGYLKVPDLYLQMFIYKEVIYIIKDSRETNIKLNTGITIVPKLTLLLIGVAPCSILTLGSQSKVVCAVVSKVK
jgi:hypothetical protein